MGVNWSKDIDQTLATAEGAIPPHLAGLQRGSGVRGMCSTGESPKSDWLGIKSVNRVFALTLTFEPPKGDGDVDEDDGIADDGYSK